MPIASWSSLELILVFGIVFIGTLVHGAVGMGLGLIAAPILLLIDPVFVPGPMLCCGLLLASLMILRERRAVDFLGLKWAVIGRLIGTVVASLLLTQLRTDLVSIVSAVLILLAVGLSLWGLDAEPEPGALIGAGTVSGIMSTLSSVGGPPIALLYQRERGPRVRATLSGFFVLGTIFSLVGLMVIGDFGVAELKATAVLIPAVALGYVLSARAVRWLDRGYTRYAILFVSTVSSIVLLSRYLR